MKCWRKGAEGHKWTRTCSLKAVEGMRSASGLGDVSSDEMVSTLIVPVQRRQILLFSAWDMLLLFWGSE